MLRLRYVPGSHGSQKRSSPWGLGHFLSSFSSSVKSRYVFSRSVKAYRDRGSTAHYGLSRMIVRFLTARHVLLGPLTFSYVPTKFCYDYRIMSRSFTVKLGRWFVFEPVFAHCMKMRPTKLLQLLYSDPLIRNIINVNEEACFVFIALLGAYT